MTKFPRAERAEVRYGSALSQPCDSVTGIVSSAVLFHPYPGTLSQELCRPQCSFIYIPGLCHRNCVVRSALSSIFWDSVTGIMSYVVFFLRYYLTLSYVLCRLQCFL